MVKRCPSDESIGDIVDPYKVTLDSNDNVDQLQTVTQDEDQPSPSTSPPSVAAVKLVAGPSHLKLDTGANTLKPDTGAGKPKLDMGASAKLDVGAKTLKPDSEAGKKKLDAGASKLKLDEGATEGVAHSPAPSILSR